MGTRYSQNNLYQNNWIFREQQALYYSFMKYVFIKTFSSYFSLTFLKSFQQNIHLQKAAKKGIYLTPYVCTDQIFDLRPFMHRKRFYIKTLIEVGCSHLYASFGTFYVQIVIFIRHSESLKTV